MNADGLTTVGARSLERENYIDWLPIYPWRQIRTQLSGVLVQLSMLSLPTHHTRSPYKPLPAILLSHSDSSTATRLSVIAKFCATRWVYSALSSPCHM